MRSKTDMLKEAKDLESKIESTRNPEKRHTLQQKMYSLRYRAGKKTEKAKPAASTRKTRVAPALDPKQMILPNFLSQINNPRVDEMVRERITEALKVSIEKKTEEILNNLFQLKAAK